MNVVEQDVRLLSITSSPAELIELAARTCYKSEDKICQGSADRLIKSCMNKNHMSVIEHASATFKIVCDRGISHEIVRHRIASFSQESTRYCNYCKEKFGKEITVVMPYGISAGGPGYEDWKSAMVQCEKAYFALLEAGHSPQIARSVLPTCLKTEVVMTANFREWMHFIDLRESSASHPQIRTIARSIRETLASYCPVVFSAE